MEDLAAFAADLEARWGPPPSAYDEGSGEGSGPPPSPAAPVQDPPGWSLHPPDQTGQGVDPGFYARDRDGNLVRVVTAARKRALREAAQTYCRIVGISGQTAAHAAALVALARRAGKSDKYACIATYRQIAENEPFSWHTLRKAVRAARAAGWLRVVYEKEAAEMNRPNTYVLLGPLRNLADIALGRSKKRAPGYGERIYNRSPYPTSQQGSDRLGDKGARPPTARPRPDRGRANSSRDRPGKVRASERSQASTERAAFRSGAKEFGAENTEFRWNSEQVADVARRGLACLDPDREPVADDGTGGSESAGDRAAEADRLIRWARAALPDLDLGISAEDFERGCRSRGLWAVAALVETAIKVRTHTRHPHRILRPGGYWAKVTFRPLSERDPLESVRRCVARHAEKLAEGCPAAGAYATPAPEDGAAEPPMPRALAAEIREAAHWFLRIPRDLRTRPASWPAARGLAPIARYEALEKSIRARLREISGYAPAAAERWEGAFFATWRWSGETALPPTARRRSAPGVQSEIVPDAPPARAGTCPKPQGNRVENPLDGARKTVGDSGIDSS